MVEEIRNSEFDDVLNSKLAVVDFSAVRPLPNACTDFRRTFG